MENKNPLSPHIQIYNWNVSSLVSISHRITGVINIMAAILICFWIFFLTLGVDSYKIILFFLNSFFGKFLIIGFTWSFSFHILSEIRQLLLDMGYGFEQKISKISGLFVIFGSFLLSIVIYLFGRNIF